ncbi:hypothetical protein QYE76_000252 [Lolium multiflorum]|uniref:Uncharacterized protein n=1 Tax=Lolium multiflorum TaxID=4521 RepID=A0AAD8VW71_LOLMU|nr:hypothetical protein QYE76_000252 [Lolium multiflorum]
MAGAVGAGMGSGPAATGPRAAACWGSGLVARGGNCQRREHAGEPGRRRTARGVRENRVGGELREARGRTGPAAGGAVGTRPAAGGTGGTRPATVGASEASSAAAGVREAAEASSRWGVRDTARWEFVVNQTRDAF